jgi:hypothetical protein
MNCGPALQREALAAGLLLSAKGEHIHIESPLGLPLCDALRELLEAHRDELLRWLCWCERADVLLLETSARIAAHRHHGCPYDDATWQAAEEALRVAYETQEPDSFHDALDRYERFALSYFTSLEKDGQK